MAASIVLSDQDCAYLDSLDDGVSLYTGKIIEHIEKRIAEGIKEGRFTEAEARADLETALRLSHALLNQDRYESYVRAALVLKGAEASAKGCGTWFYRLGCALIYCGKLAEAKARLEQGIREAPDYPWCWLELAKLRAHFGDREGALQAAALGLRLVPGDPEFVRLQKEIVDGADFLTMEFHLIDPDADKQLLENEATAEEILEKRRTLFCIFTDEAALAEIKAFFNFSEFLPADPPERIECAGVSSVTGAPLHWQFIMNEAGLSHLSLSWLRRAVEALPQSMAAQSLAPEDIAFVRVYQNRIVALQPKASLDANQGIFFDYRRLLGDGSRTTAVGTADRVGAAGEAAADGRSQTMNDDERAMLEKIAQLNKAGDYRAIIETVEALAPDARTPAILGELARAYNNLAKPGDDELFEHALEVLRTTAAESADTHEWNFRVGYALYYLDRDGEAMRFFERALQLKPGDEDTLSMLASCRRTATYPIFMKPFADRMTAVWTRFEEAEAAVREDLTAGRRAQAIARTANALRAVAADWAVEFSHEPDASGRWTLVLSPQDAREFVMPLLALIDAAPQAVKAKWNLQAGRSPAVLSYEGDELLKPQEIRVWTEKTDQGSVKLRCWSEALSGLSAEEAEPFFARLMPLLDQAIGEAVAMRWIAGLSISLVKPEDGEGVLLKDLRQRFIELVPEAADFSMKDLAQARLDYWLKPVEEPDADLYLDVGEGYTLCSVLMNAYRDINDAPIDALARQGIAAGFFYFEGFKSLSPEARWDAAKSFLTELKASLEAAHGAQMRICGAAVGRYRFYLDLYAWTLPPVLEAVNAFLEGKPEIEKAGFHTYRRTAGSLILKSAD